MVGVEGPRVPVGVSDRGAGRRGRVIRRLLRRSLPKCGLAGPTGGGVGGLRSVGLSADTPRPDNAHIVLKSRNGGAVDRLVERFLRCLVMVLILAVGWWVWVVVGGGWVRVGRRS